MTYSALGPTPALMMSTWPLEPSAPLPLYHNRSTAVTVDQLIASHGYNLCKDLLSLRVMKPIQNRPLPLFMDLLLLNNYIYIYIEGRYITVQHRIHAPHVSKCAGMQTCQQSSLRWWKLTELHMDQGVFLNCWPLFFGLDSAACEWGHDSP